MKILLPFLLFFCFVFWVCGKNDQTKKYDDEFNTAVSQGKSPSVRLDNIFMDFRFGQTRSEVKEHYKKLAKEKTLQICNDGAYRDIITLDPSRKYYNNITVNISEDYFEDRLYNFTLSLKNDSGNELLDNSISPIMMIDVHKAFETRYPQTIWITNKEQGSGNLLSFEGVEKNRFIKISDNEKGHVIISYIDLIALARIDSVNQVKKSQDYDKTLKIL
jgi:hypothetical protein